MRHEFAKATCFIEQVRPLLNETFTLHILINDQDCKNLRAYAASVSSYISVHCEGINFGVAGGRNLLIRRAVDAGAEFLISCDTDIIYDAAYFERLSKGYADLAKRDPKLGFIQPVLLDGREVRRFFPVLEKATDWSGLSEQLKRSSDWRNDLWQVVKEKRGLEKAIWTIYHSGVSNLWKAHFGPPTGPEISAPWDRFDWLETYRTTHPTLRSELPVLTHAVESGEPIRVGSCAGGVVAFHAKVIKQIGEYAEIFNPFGYEDSEMGFRSMMAGCHNYLVTNAFAIHDIFMGESNRSLLSHSRIGLLRGVEAMHVALSSAELNYIISQSAVYSIRDLLNSFGAQVKKGVMTVAEGERLIGGHLMSYAFDFIRGAVHTVASRQDVSADSPLMQLLRGFIEGNGGLSDFSVPLGRDVCLLAGQITSRKRLDRTGAAIYSVFASNCRVVESTKTEKLESRYFDASFVATPIGDRQYSIIFDVQSNDICLNFEKTIEVAEKNNISEGSIRTLEHHFYRKQYEFGRFSVEEIYPSPTIYKSTGWLPVAQKFVSSVTTAAKFPVIVSAADSLLRYLSLSSNLSPLSVGNIPRTPAVRKNKKRILVFCDSRGQHKPAGGQYPIFGERLAADDGLDVDLFLCPMKWTTTLDFLENFEEEKLKSYDHVILYTGIVEWSPRRWSSAMADLYDNPMTLNTENLELNTRDYSKKIVNCKKKVFDEVFGEAEMARHFDRPLGTLFEGEKTANMYSLEMAGRSLLPRLKAIPNLIFITANRFVEGWSGDYRRERPANISLVHGFSELFSKSLTTAKVIDLLKWSQEEVKEYTCDNLHLTQRGSDYIYERIVEVIEVSRIKNAVGARPAVAPGGPVAVKANVFSGMRALERITTKKKPAILTSVTCKSCLATLIIGVRLDPVDEIRTNNLRFLLDWLDFYYGELFDVLLIEQDVTTRVDLPSLGAKRYVRHEFIYNPDEYNRGWGYNVAVSRFCESVDVVVLMDTDVLTGANFVSEVKACYSKYDAISPYQNIYYTDEKESAHVRSTRTINSLCNPQKIKNPVTISGGILIIRRDVFVALKGFEQYVGYSCEDRALDVTLYNHLDPARIRVANETYVHLHHASDAKGRIRFDEIYGHLQSNYRCNYDPTLGPYDFIHKNCNHPSSSETLRLMIERADSFGDPDLYRKPVKPSVNGIVPRSVLPIKTADVTYPPDFQSLDSYAVKEIYESAPLPDSEEIGIFYNAFKGKRCFIIGNGPSLNKHDLSLLEGEYTFGVNSFYYKTRETGFRPFFYVVEDSSVMKENIEEIRQFDAPFKFFPTNYRKLHPKQPNTFFFRMNRGFYEKSSPNYVVPRFSTDATDVLYCGQSVTYINLQLAYFMGFSEVYLIGMDFGYVIPQSHKRTGDVLLSDTDDMNHFHKDYFGKGKTWKDPKLDRVALNYKMAKLVYEATGRKIFNATVGGSLEIFERVSYRELLGAEARGTAGAVDFRSANDLYRKGRYADAVSAYIDLARANDSMFLYKRSAVDAYMKACEAQQACSADDVAFVRTLFV
jgi:GT2 family glycosyltransferase